MRGNSQAQIQTNIHENDIRFIIVGDGMSRAELEQDIINADVSEYFVFLGQKPAEEMPNYYAAADVLFLAYSQLEALEIAIPAKLASYFATGKPCVVSISGEGANAVVNANAGLVSAPDDANKLCENILRMAKMKSKSPEELENMGKSAKEYCKKHFKRDIILKMLEEFILQ